MHSPRRKHPEKGYFSPAIAGLLLTNRAPTAEILRNAGGVRRTGVRSRDDPQPLSHQAWTICASKCAFFVNRKAAEKHGVGIVCLPSHGQGESTLLRGVSGDFPERYCPGIGCSLPHNRTRPGIFRKSSLAQSQPAGMKQTIAFSVDKVLLASWRRSQDPAKSM